jgi:hypothetical protein
MIDQASHLNMTCNTQTHFLFGYVVALRSFSKKKKMKKAGFRLRSFLSPLDTSLGGIMPIEGGPTQAPAEGHHCILLLQFGDNLVSVVRAPLRRSHPSTTHLHAHGNAHDTPP